MHVLVIGRKFASANEHHYPDLGRDTSSVRNIFVLASDVISQRTRKNVGCFLRLVTLKLQSYLPQKLAVFLHFRQLESVINNDRRDTQRLFQSTVSAILCTKVAFGKRVFKAIKRNR